MDNQPNQPHSTKNSPKKAGMWVIIIIVVIIIAGGLYYILTQDNTGNTNNADTTNTVVNTVANVNENVNENTNTETNTNEATNENINAGTNTNTTVDISGWETYSNTNFSYTFKYPSEYAIRDLTNYADSTDTLSYIGVGPTIVESGLIFYVQVYSSNVSLSSVIDEIQTKWSISDNKVVSDDRFGTDGKKLTRDVTELEEGSIWYVFKHNRLVYEVNYLIPHPTASESPDIIGTFSL